MGFLNKTKMVKLYTCILALVMFTATLASTHNEHEHLSLEFVQNEATRLTLLEAYSVYRKIENNKEAVKIIINKHNKIMENAPDKEEGKRIWKNVYEESLADDIDRAIIAQHVCNALHGPAEKCDVGI